MSEPLTETDHAIFMRAALDVFAEEVDGLKDRYGSDSEKSSELLAKALGDVDEATAKTLRETERYERRLRELEHQPKKVEFVQPKYQNDTHIDMAPVAVSVEKVGEHVAYAIKNLPQQDNAPLLGILREFAEILAAMKEEATENRKAVAAQNQLLVKLVKALAEQKPLTIPDIKVPEIKVGDLAEAFKKHSDGLAKLLADTMSKVLAPLSAKKPRRIAEIDHSDPAKTKIKITDE